MQLPLLFNFKQIVLGNGFIAGVRMTGRALMEEGDGEVWINGVSPASIAGGGQDRTSAFVDFRQGWESVLFDIADGVGSFEEFKGECERFLRSSVASLDRDWDDALAEVRRLKYTDPSLRTVSADKQTYVIEVCELKPAQSLATKNEVEVGLAAAA
ncbi:MAG: hypothetical protein IT459_23400 [Planctomycetes bacterium]|nr:hypothetical protein [Planctomycetota bacterium]